MENFLLFYWKFQFFLSTGDKHFLTKPENSKTPQGGGIQLSQISLLTLRPLPGAGGGGSPTWDKNRPEMALARCQKCCKLWLGAQSRSLQKRRRGLWQQGIIYDVVHLKKGKKFPCQNKLRQKAFKKGKGDNIFDCWLKDRSLDAAATSTGAEV